MVDIDKSKFSHIVAGTGANGTLKTGDDLIPKVKKTIGEYLSELSKENKQTLKSGLEEVSLVDSNGEPAALDLQGRGSNNPFAPIQENPALSTYSDSGQFAPSVNDLIKKGTDGNNYTKDKSEKIGRAVSEVLKRNRFTADEEGENKRFITNREVPNSIGPIQNLDLGKYRSQGQEVLMSDLQKVGISLMLRAAGELKAATDGDPTSFGAGAASLVPGKTQLAIVKVDNNELRAGRAFGSPYNDVGEEKISLGSDINAGESKSWGSLNTPLEPFDGFLPIGMTILGTALTVALTLVTKGIIGLFGLIVKPRSDISFAPAHGPFISGQFGRPDPPNTFFSLRIIGIQPTDRDFLQCVNEGLNVFFGFDGASFKRIAQAPGFYTVFVRNVIRSGNIIINDIKDVFTNNQNPISAVQDFIGIVDTLKQSKIIAFLNILAQIGDRSLELKSTGFNGGRVISTNDFIKENPTTRQGKSRVSRSDLQQTMRTSAVPSKFLFSKESLKASNILSSAGSARIDQAISGLGSSVASDDEIVGNRISTEAVEKMEGELDAEYVPFYFHDLRTNEIIGFHAFLENLEDQYTPNYEKEEGYGRIDPIMTYKSTERNVTFTFSVIATSKSDFDIMWWKINKLVNMLYPQWSEGRQVRSIEQSKSFIQPFSQIPTASPFIRLRIGDLIKSNYSKFNLARLFGLGSDKASDLVDIELSNNFSISKAKETRERMLRNPALFDPLKSGYKVGETAMLMPRYNGYNESKNSPPSLLATAFRTGEAKKLIIPNATKVKIVKSPNNSPEMIQNYGEHHLAYYIIEVDGIAGQADDLKGQFLCTFYDLYPDNKQIAKIAANQTVDVTEQSNVPISTTFFEADENTITRSFRSIQGKGLAGFITGFNLFELAGPTAVWETMEYNSRAPKIVKINVTFSPVHDIPPGLDAQGFPRAITYPVGGVAAKVAGEVDNGAGGGEDNFDRYSAEAYAPFRDKGDLS